MVGRACIQRARILDFFVARDLIGMGRSGLLQCKQRCTSARVDRWQAGQYRLGIEVISAISFLGWHRLCPVFLTFSVNS